MTQWEQSTVDEDDKRGESTTVTNMGRGGEYLRFRERKPSTDEDDDETGGGHERDDDDSQAQAVRDDDSFLADLMSGAEFGACAVTKERGPQLEVARGEVRRAAVTEEGKADLEGGKGAELLATFPPPTNVANPPEDVAEPAMDDKPVVGGGNEPCVHDERGVCQLHGQAQKKLKPGKVWTKLKNGLFGWKYKRTTYFVCGTVTHPSQGAPGPTFVSMRKSSKQQNTLIASSNRCSSGRRLGE